MILFYVYTSIAKDEEMFLVPFIVCCCLLLHRRSRRRRYIQFQNILFLLHQRRTPLHIHAKNGGWQKERNKSCSVLISLYA